ncbi:hypothetical protein EDB19DRAFT_1627517 [Suillus lakei]|nr:hypothetical protein EDB19DRAFT_1627517 [Suillus lakei]
MHACLLIPEIVKLIFANVYVSSTGGCSIHIDDFRNHYSRRIARRSLAALSRVCRSFKDIALDVLWSKLENLEPPFACLPRDLWTMSGDRKLLIQRPITTADWLVFEKYATRVRVLGDTDSDLFGGIHVDFIYAMMGFCSQSLLVPNLRALYCKEHPCYLHLCLRYLLGPSLACLFLVAPTEGSRSNIMTSVLSGLARHSPRLEVVEVVGPHEMSPEVSELAFCGLTHLRRAALVLPGHGDLSWLSRLRGIQELRIDFAGFQVLPLLRSQFRTSYLDKLAIGSFNLTSSANSVTDWVVPCRQLQLVSNFPESAVAVEHIHPLMRFSGMKVVDLSASCMSLLDDDALGSIVKSWPRLECLYLGTKHYSQTPPKITFRGLVTLLSTCPSLRNLGLVFDATKVDSPTAEKPGGGVCNTNITSFHVGFSPIEQPLQVAVSLSAVLSCLREFSVESYKLLLGSPGRVAREAKWKEVSEHISVYTLIRKQESNAKSLETRSVTRRSTRKKTTRRK